MTRKLTLAVLSLLIAAPPAAVRAQGADLTGAGATFPYPIYSKWFDTYASTKGVKINYQSIGSGGGIRQLVEQTVDFGASDGPMSDQEMAGAKGGAVLHIPTVIGALAIVYNLDLKQPLKLSGDVVADIFLGKITKWNDARMVALNPGVVLPKGDILVVHRSECQRHIVRVHGLPVGGEPGMEGRTGAGQGCGVAGGSRQQRQ